MNRTQCRMARAALGWSLDDLAAASGINRRTILRHEKGETVQPESVEAMRSALARASVGFTNGGGRVGVTVKRED